MATRMQQRRGTASQWTSANPILAAGEIGFETDNNKFKIGDGVNHWADLSYFTDAASIAALVDNAPDLMNTLNEIAAALGDNPNFISDYNDTIDGINADLALTAPRSSLDELEDNFNAHANATTQAHGVTDFGDLVTSSQLSTAVGNLEDALTTDIDGVQTALNNHNADGTNVHGIADTADLALKSGTTMTGDLTLAGAPTSNLHAATKAYVDSAVSTHDSDSTNVHGISDTSELETQTGAQAKADAAELAATNAAALDATTKADAAETAANGYTDSQIDAHVAVTTNVHGIADTTKIVLKNAASTTLDGSLTVDGDFTVNGTNFSASATSITIEDNMVQLAHQNAANTVDLGLVVAYNDGTAKHAGIVRDVSDSKWKLFKGVTTEPSTTVDFTQGSLDDLAVSNLTASSVVFTDGTQSKEGVPSRTPIVSKTASYTLSALSERDSMIEVSSSSATTLTIPAESSVNFPVGTSIDVLQTSTGQVTIAGAGGVTVNATPGLKLRTQWSSATLFKRAADTWVVYGDLMA
jgi:hypothetical protein